MLLAIGLWILSALNNRSDISEVEVQQDSGVVAEEMEEEPNADSSVGVRETGSDHDDGDAGDKESQTFSAQDVTDIVLTETGVDFRSVIRGRTITLSESIETKEAIYVVADELLLREGAKIHAPQIWVFAKRLSGGMLDTSAVGSSEDGGSIYVVADRVEGTSFLAIGGDGAEGKKGTRGRDGRDGSCAGFGDWEPNSRGGRGSRGGKGGRAGNGGDVKILYGNVESIPSIDLSPGQPGNGGPGGDGGRGGEGCVGLGGIQEGEPSGPQGPDGPSGDSGKQGEVEKRRADVNSKLEEIRNISVLTISYLRHVKETESVWANAQD